MNHVFYTDNPARDFNRWDAAQEKRLAKLPLCADCGEPIQDDCYYQINDEAICLSCIKANYRREIEC